MRIDSDWNNRYAGASHYMIERHRIETIVRERYAAGTKSPEAKLCCPVNYESEYLEVIPREVTESDYGCGDPFTKRRPTVSSSNSLSRLSMRRWPKQSRSILRAPLCGTRRKPKARITT